MKKTHIAIAVVGVLAVAYVGSTWYIGTHMESRIDQRIEDLNTRLATEFAINNRGDAPYLKKLSYESGIFSSQARYAVFINGHQELELLNEISHGPLPWAALSHGMFAPAMTFSKMSVQPTPENAEQIKAIFNEQAPFVGYTRMNFDETVNLDWRIAAAKRNSANLSLDFAGLNLVGSASLEGGTLDIKGGSGGLALSITDDDDKFTLAYGKLDYEAKTTRNPIGITVGKSRVSMTDFTLRDIGDNPEQLLAVQNTEVQSSISSDGPNSIGGDFNYRIDGITVDKEQLGDLLLNIRVSHLDGPSLAALVQIYDEKVSSGELAQLNSPSELLNIPSVQKNLIGVLKKNPQLLITLNATNAAGKSDLNIAVNAGAAKNPAQPGPEILKRAQASLTLDAAMVAQAYRQALTLSGKSAETAKEIVDSTLQNTFDDLLKDGALTRTEAGQYAAHISFENGELSFNNEKLPPFMIPLLLSALVNSIDTPNFDEEDQAPTSESESESEPEEFRFEEQ